MQIIDEKFPQQKMRYVSQSLLATFVLGYVFLFLDMKSNAAIVASLGASSFIAFTMPQAQVSRPRFLLGGYIVACIIGTGYHYLLKTLIFWNVDLPPESLVSMLAAASVGTAIFIMVVFNFEHPPAAGLALGLVINEWSFKKVIVVLVGIVLLVAIKALLKPMLKNLL
ncbi:HPP family protein [Fibrobacterota bacterium]